MPEGITEIAEYTFNECENLKEVKLPETLTSIAQYAFRSCKNLTSITIPKSVTAFSSFALYYCDNITVYCYSGSVVHKVLENLNYNYVLLDSHEHDYSVTQVVEPSCTTDGIRKYTCNICGYDYKEKIEKLGHTYVDTIVEADCVNIGYTNHVCSRCNDSYSSDFVAALGHKYDEWIIDKEATVLSTGEMHRQCSVCDYIEKKEVAKKEVNLSDNQNYGKVNFTVVDAVNLTQIPNAQIYISTESDGEETLYTDNNGKLSQILPVGSLTISVYADGYLARNLTITVEPGEQDLPVIGISKQKVVEGKLTATEMTREEMIDAGIDVNNPENNHVFKYEAEIQFDAEIDTITISSYFNGNGKFLGGSGGGGCVSNPGSAGFGFPFYHSDSSKGGNTTTNGGNGFGWILSDGTEVTIYPVTEKFYLIIYGEVHWLKEMYNVQLLVINNSMTDTIENCEAELSLPDGLSLVDMIDGKQSLLQEIGHVDSGASKSVNWYVRGDKEGIYNISAKLRGSLMPYNEAFEYSYEAESPIKVYAGSAMHMTFIFPDSAFYGDDYTIRIELQNVSDKILYGVKHKITGFKQCKVTEYSDGTVVNETYMEKDNLGQVSVDEFKPGDKLVIEITTNIMFQSEIIENGLNDLIGKVSGIEDLYNMYKGYKEFADLIKGADGFFQAAYKSVDKVADSITQTAEQIKAYSELAGEISKLLGKMQSGDAESLKIVKKLEGTEAYKAIKEIAETNDAESFFAAKTIKEIIQIADILKAANDELKDEEDTKKFNIFESIRTAISLIPVRFKVDDFMVTTLSGSTTTIPSSYAMEKVGARYNGVDSYGQYIYSLGIAAMGKQDIKGLSLIGIGKDITGYEKAVEYIKSVENQAKKFAAKSATGETTFKAWVEESAVDVQSVGRISARNLSDKSFELKTDNDTAVYENGILTFKGDSILDVTPLSKKGGILHIQDDEGNTYEYVIEVVGQHECYSDEWITVMEPMENSDGLKVKCCDICDDIIGIEPIKHCEVHDYSDFTVTKEASCTEIGEKYRVCSVCGAEQYEYIQYLDHEEGDWKIVKEATAFEKGQKDLYCKRCNSVIRSEVIPCTKETYGYSKDSTDKIISGFPENVTPDMLIQHYKELGIEVTISNPDGQIPQYVGTGTKLYFENNDEYEAVLKGDVTGDGQIDLFDYYEILDYLNNDKILDGVYLKAGLITAESVSIFDAYAIIDYINGCGSLN